MSQVVPVFPCHIRTFQHSISCKKAKKNPSKKRVLVHWIDVPKKTIKYNCNILTLHLHQIIFKMLPRRPICRLHLIKPSCESQVESINYKNMYVTQYVHYVNNDYLQYLQHKTESSVTGVQSNAWLPEWKIIKIYRYFIVGCILQSQ